MFDVLTFFVWFVFEFLQSQLFNYRFIHLFCTWENGKDILAFINAQNCSIADEIDLLSRFNVTDNLVELPKIHFSECTIQHTDFLFKVRYYSCFFVHTIDFFILKLDAEIAILAHIDLVVKSCLVFIVFLYFSHDESTSHRFVCVQKWIDVFNLWYFFDLITVKSN